MLSSALVLDEGQDFVCRTKQLRFKIVDALLLLQQELSSTFGVCNEKNVRNEKTETFNRFWGVSNGDSKPYLLSGASLVASSRQSLEQAPAIAL